MRADGTSRSRSRSANLAIATRPVFARVLFRSAYGFSADFSGSR